MAATAICVWCKKALGEISIRRGYQNERLCDSCRNKLHNRLCSHYWDKISILSMVRDYVDYVLFGTHGKTYRIIREVHNHFLANPPKQEEKQNV